MAEGKLTLNNWSLGMSADEYSGGSFFYSEGIDSYSSSKSFKLGHSLGHTEINKRSAGYAVALEPVFELDEEGYNYIGMVSFSSDGYIESNGVNRGASPDGEFGGGIYKRPSGGYVNGLAISNTLLGISNNKIDRFTSLTNLWGSNLVNNPGLTSNTGWTVGAGWTTGASGATHTSGDLTLRQSLTLTTGKKYRIVVKSSGTTTGSCEVRLGISGIVGTINSSSDVCFLGTINASYDGLDIIFIPTTTFNGTIEYVKVQEYDSTKLLPDNITITDYVSHPVCLWQGDIYIGSGDKLDIVSTTDRDVRTLSIIDTGYTIRSITNQGGNLVIWASNGKDSKQYYWNGVDNLASEVIDWDGNNIAGVITDETKNYVIVSNNYDRRMYVVSGYQRQLIANNVFNGRTIERGREPYNINKKYNFDVSGHNQMALLNDKLYVRAFGGIYVFGGNVPGIGQSWSKPIKFDMSAASYPYSYAMNSMFGRMHFSYRSDGINYITQIYEYKYTTKGYLVTTSILWDNISSRKNLTKLKIGYRNIKKDYGNIKVYAIVDDDYFWRYQVTSVTTRPSIGDKYNVGTDTVGEIIAIEDNGTTGVITFKTTENTANYPGNYLSSITRVTGTGQATISTGRLFDNMCLLKTIESDYQEYGSDLIFSKNFIDAHMPDWHKIQLVIELNSNNSKISPEIYDVSLLSDIVDTDV